MDLSTTKENYVINISVLGKSGAGKTATIVKLLTKRFIGEYSSVIDDKYFFTLQNDSKEYLITILDTTDQASIDLDHIVKWSHIIVVMFSIIDRSSFNKALILLQLITDECLKREEKYDITICLVANKIDLNRFRVVLSDEGVRLTKEFPISYFESSVIYSHTVIENLFLQIIKNYLNDEDDLSQQDNTNFFLREKSSSPFTNVGMLGHLVRRQSTKNLRNSVTSINDSELRRNSIENGRRLRANDSESNISSSKTSLNNLFNSSTKRIKAEGLKFFKRPK